MQCSHVISNRLHAVVLLGGVPWGDANWAALFLLSLQVLITPHTAFLTSEALDNIASTTIMNVEEYLQDKPLTNALKPKPQK